MKANIARCGNACLPSTSASPPATPVRVTRVLQPEVPRDDHALDLVRALADLEDLLVAEEARDRRLLHEPVSAVDLQRRVRRAVRQEPRVELRHRRLEGE